MRKAFTAVEILVVIGISTLFVSAGAFSLRAYQPTAALRSASRELVVNLRFTSAQAVATQLTHTLQLYNAQSRYDIVGGDGQIIRTISLPSGITIAQTSLPQNQATFNVLGAAQDPGTITLQNINSLTSIIDIRPSGYVKIIQ
ncbi:hypothetical protein A3B21_02550 [Candidatus Uhrbacteria bacterium RIFCSPLOWO2_01_FULL_47_24]|uniref:General secretion pathway GspH domain-containing protein n=1 Tax=Candidatus Uhrbacteria bacterium RIFCSPLOWO2_01_FULL_47_24 TaxID=1802401 RepID=A0A1F7UP02_9BACT|nr:MAG: hypothetical protein A2753_02290 [Candidatus Uhrbacteria bacterium RIFCSPHIGHO2_01_FULL_47_11]OGL68285.1 MAG: hypothetical protein A3D58_04770 [Candidatus Uhrbacteria bacterium RIFCSPHIGHO2_02_FULL_46_47]OGL75697.1 MAG: hypothetical protein A3F52_01780 [Candidatus Uhrbacteria bacterium RIFCSPHIGHO2_12_FULL_47_11]OGL80023.1 MAG: hypothetical protein A3B21_02550 [Candidatus Uhrbacteria bacterium RIFCSPLOWO2_01_FULL_47_24]OGL85221.1 MAG: hypothetical protein A3J03_00140 [Candidatus Uhrbact